MANFVDYTLLFIATAIILYILIRMINKRMAAKKTTAPAFDNTPNSAQMKQLASVQQNTKGVAIKNASFPISQDNSLRNFIIKSSFNSAYTGGYMNIEMVNYVLKRGCRFLHLQVFIKDNTAIVAYSKDDFEGAFSSNPPALSLGGVFSTINMNAFNQHVPNPNDPLFIHLQIMSSLPNANSIVAQTIAANFEDNLYVDPNTKKAVSIDLNVQLQRLCGKVVILTDESRLTMSPSTAPNSATSMQLTDYVNLFVNKNNVQLYTESQLTMQPINPPNPYVYNFFVVQPNLGLFYEVVNANADYLIRNYGSQVVCEAFYRLDNNLTQYENIFNGYQSAFVPISSYLT